MTSSGTNGEQIAYELETLADMPNYTCWIVDGFRPYLRGAGLEIGAGLGTIAAETRPHFDRLTLLEPSTPLVERLAARFVDDESVTVIEGTFEEAAAGFISESYDAIVMVNVLEHIEDDVAALKECFRLLKPDGHLLIYVPALQALYSTIDKLFGHYRRYSRKVLVGKITAAGLVPVRVRYMDLLGVLPWWLVNKVGGATQLNPHLTRLYDRLGVPATRAFELLVSPPLGKNIIMLARRPSSV